MISNTHSTGTLRSQCCPHSGALSMYLPVLALLMSGLISACYWNDRTSYRYFGSITPYDDVRGDIRDVALPDGCEPIRIWFMARHGTRHPGTDDVEIMKNMTTLKGYILKSHAEGRSELCAQDISNLQKWTWDDSKDSAASALTDEGYQELLELGTRFHEKFYSFLEKLDFYHFRPSTEQRTKMAAKAFTEGLGMHKWSFDVSEAMEKDEVVRPYKHCKIRTDEILNGPHIQNEINKYYETKEFKQMLKNVQQRIGIDQEITPQNATGLYDLCRFYRATSNTRSDPWCALFSNEDLEIMEYVGDVRHYYRNGYGGGLVNKKLGEIALKDMFEKFQSINDTRSITGYFTHDTMIEMVYSALGLYNDYPDISGCERVKNRLWRSSFNAPFAANFVAILNRCNNTGFETRKIQFFINEIEIRLCKELACSWEDFIKKCDAFANSNLEFCQNTQQITKSEIINYG